ncbi:MAG: alpha/beta hydrolase [Chloroflexota bacterium]
MVNVDTTHTSIQLPRFDHRDIPVNGLRLHYVEVEGSGPSLVLLHGIGMDWRVWQALSRRLKPFFHLYLLDLRGHGQSDKPERGYSLAHYAADVEEFIDHQRLEQATIIGSSLGAMVAVSVEAPTDIVSHRVLIDPPLTGGPVRDESTFETILRLKHGGVDSLTTYLAAANPGSGKYLLRTMAEMWLQASDGVITDMLDAPNTYFAVDHALRLDESPTLIVQADPQVGGVVSDEQVQRALQVLPHGSWHAFPGVGHAVHAFVPQELTRLVTEFVGLG